MLHELKSSVRQFRLQHETYIWFALEVSAVVAIGYCLLKLLVVMFSIAAGYWPQAVLGLIAAMSEAAAVMAALVLCLMLPVLVVDSARYLLTRQSSVTK